MVRMGPDRRRALHGHSSSSWAQVRGGDYARLALVWPYRYASVSRNVAMNDERRILDRRGDLMAAYLLAYMGGDTESVGGALPMDIQRLKKAGFRCKG